MYFILGILLIPFLIAYFKEFLFVISFFFKNWQLYRPFLYGFGGYSFWYLIFLRKQMSFWETLSHELTHAVFAVLCFRKIDGMMATDVGEGITAYTTGPSNFLIRLTPYFFPLYLSLLLGLGTLLKVINSHNFQIILGVAGGFHFYTILQQLRPFQPDLKAQGLLFSYIFIALMNLIFISCVLIVLRSGWGECGQFFRNGFSQTLSFYQQGYVLLRALIPNG